VWHFGDGICFILGDHSIFHLSRFIMLHTDRCGTKMVGVLHSERLLVMLYVDAFFDVLFFSYYGFFVSPLVPLCYEFPLVFLSCVCCGSRSIQFIPILTF
jgi:hypothetical protein